MGDFNGSKLETSAGFVITEVRNDINISRDSSPDVVSIFATNGILNKAVVIGVKFKCMSYLH